MKIFSCIFIFGCKKTYKLLNLMLILLRFRLIFGRFFFLLSLLSIYVYADHQLIQSSLSNIRPHADFILFFQVQRYFLQMVSLDRKFSSLESAAGSLDRLRTRGHDTSRDNNSIPKSSNQYFSFWRLYESKHRLAEKSSFYLPSQSREAAIKSTLCKNNFVQRIHVDTIGDFSGNIEETRRKICFSSSVITRSTLYVP